MLIKKLEYKIHSATPVVSFKIALMEQATSDSVILRVETDNGLVAYGEALSCRRSPYPWWIYSGRWIFNLIG